MLKRYAGIVITLGIIGGAAAILLLNLESGGTRPAPSNSTTDAKPAAPAGNAAGFREYPIGDDIERDGLRIAAVWLPPVHMAGMDMGSGSDMIHLEADVHALEGNPNGFAKDEFVPYLKIAYRITPADGGPTSEGVLRPMVARDGLHYGASVALPKAGRYRLVYAVEPPAAELGRHDDPITGVAPWWTPFEASFDWDYAGPPK